MVPAGQREPRINLRVQRLINNSTQERARGPREVVTDWEREREIVPAASCMFELIINESQSRK